MQDHAMQTMAANGPLSFLGLSAEAAQGVGIGLALGAVALVAVSAFLWGRAARPTGVLTALTAASVLLLGSGMYLALGSRAGETMSMMGGGRMMGGQMGGGQMGGGQMGGGQMGMSGSSMGGMSAADAESVAVGRGLFELHCVSCHGDEGVGDGPLASTLPVRPANILEHLGHHPDEELLDMILRGIPPAMPPMPISDEEARMILQYMRTLPEAPGGEHLH